MVNPARLLMELLRWACDGGATVLNYVEAVALERRGDRIDGVVAVDRVTQETMVFRTKKVVNCAGPWTRRLAAEFDQDIPSMGTLALAFGMLVDREAPSPAALAVTANSDTKATCFLVPWGDRLCVGTHNAEWSGPIDKVTVSESELGDLMAAVNGALPRLELGRSQILRVYSGLVPTLHQDAVTPADRPVVIDHEAYGGPSGLVSLIGVKYTTAPAVARRAVTAALGNAGRRERKWSPRPRTRDEVARLDLNSADAMLRSPSDRTQSGLRALTDDESVIHLDDLVLRRSDWGQSRSEGMDVGAHATVLLGWPAERRDAELKRLEAALEAVSL